jgi:phage terminase large subunit
MAVSYGGAPPDVRIIPYSPRKLQEELHDKVKRFSVLVMHRRFGKTVFAINHMIRHLLTVADHARPQGAYIAPTYGQAKRIAWEYFKDYARPIGARFNETELKITFPTGAVLYLYGAENPDAIRGNYFHIVVLDEYGDMHPRLYAEVVRPALSDYRGHALWIGTPKGANQFKKIFDVAAREMRAGNEDWFCDVKRASETGIIDAAELEEARRVMSSAEYEQEFECSWSAAIRGAYYAERMDKLRELGRIARLPHEPNLPVYTGWDLGMSDSTAIWFAQVFRGEYRLIDYYEASGEGLRHFVNVLKDKEYIYERHFFPHDVMVRELSTGASRQEVLAGFGVKATALPRLPVQDGIEAVRGILPNCWFDDGDWVSRGVEAVSHYHREWDDRRGDYRDRPVHDWSSHAADALRTLAIGLTRDFQRSSAADVVSSARRGRLADGRPLVVSGASREF